MKITNRLKISKQDFRELYPLADHEIFFRDPKSDIEFEERYLTNKLWRLNNLYTIVDKHGNICAFIMNKSQHKVFKASTLHPRLLILKSRQQGISTFWLLSYFDDAIFEEHLYIGLMSQGRAESGTLLTRTKLAWDKLNGDIKTYAEIGLKKDNADEVGLSNGSTIFIRTSFRSATLQRLHISEYGKICNKYPERAKETKTGTLQAIAPGNTIVIESTAEGHNDFKTMWEKAEGRELKTLGPKEFLAVFLSWLDDPDCVSNVDRIPSLEHAKYFAEAEEELGITISQEQKNFWIDQYDELIEVGTESSAIFQEYPMTPEEAFKAIREGTYYAELYMKFIVGQNRVVPNLWDHNLPVEVFVDLGMNDEFVLLFVQKWQKEIRIIHEYKNSGLGISHYVDYMFEDKVCKQFHIVTVYLPWDAEVRELGTGMSRYDRFYECGARNLYLLPKININTGIELTRKLIPYIWVDESCTYLIGCFLNYSKEWEEKVQNWKDKPLHNVWSHGADDLRYIAVSVNSGINTIHSAKSSKRKAKAQSVVDGLAL